MSLWVDFVRYMSRPCHPSNLAVCRILFGFLMLLDIFKERGMPQFSSRWDNPNECRFPLFDFMILPSMPCVHVIYSIMILGTIGIVLGLAFKTSCLLYVSCYWYVFLLDKSRWNNHSYLYGLLASLLLFTDANACWSLDGVVSKKKRFCEVPFWNYFVLRGQVFLVYFIAGIKKFDHDWISGHSMEYLSSHWVFHIFKYVMSDENIDFYVVHMGGFTLDLSAGFLLSCNKTRSMAYFFIGMFHLMNSQIFHIGMFPYVMLATMPLFSSYDWPMRFFKLIPLKITKTIVSNDELNYNSNCLYVNAAVECSTKKILKRTSNIQAQHIFPIIGLVAYFIMQAFLPFSHFLTPGYNTWTGGLYGYSWDMMVHSWRYVHNKITVVDTMTGHKQFLDPDVWTQNYRWTHHADMVKQFASCMEPQMLEKLNTTKIEIYVDVWMSLNGRFAQRVFDPNVNILTASWSPTEHVSWVMPVLNDLSHWRTQFKEIERQYMYSGSQYEDVVFVVDFPKLSLVNFVDNFNNTMVKVLCGEVALEVLYSNWSSFEVIQNGESVAVPSGHFHRISPLNRNPACYFYVYGNSSRTML